MASLSEAQLAPILDEARAVWPGVEVPPEELADYLARRLPAAVDPEAGLRVLNTSDLFIACAVARGDALAIAALEERYFPVIDAALSRLHASPAVLEDIKQLLRVQLFVAPSADRPPGIHAYSGRGQLRRWLRITAVRAAMRRLGIEEREVAREEAELDRLIPPGEDLEIGYLKRAYRAELEAAFAHALASLSRRERVLLRQRYIDRLGNDRLGRIYKVHRATLARWLAGAREKLLRETRAALMEQLSIGEESCSSLLRLIESNLELTLSGFL
jgi:RNA polymerase sigma-70 factor (ECF subfamily)